MKNVSPAACGVLVLLTACSAPTKQVTGQPAVRVGTYDGRAVVIAYAGSDMFGATMKELHAKHDAAKAAGDTALANKLEKQAIDQQALFHRQAFEGASVDDILARFRPDVAAIREKAKVERLERINQPRPESTETVDVTDMLVALLDPNEKAQRWIRDIRTKPFPKHAP